MPQDVIDVTDIIDNNVLIEQFQQRGPFLVIERMNGVEKSLSYTVRASRRDIEIEWGGHGIFSPGWSISPNGILTMTTGYQLLT